MNGAEGGKVGESGLEEEREPARNRQTNEVPGGEARVNRYARLIERLFLDNYQPGATEVGFHRAEMERIATELGIKLPKNIGDVIYSMRYRTPLPASVREKAPEGQEWVILPAGRSRYRFKATDIATIAPRAGMIQIRVPDSTPGLISMYALSDEQALLAKVRYNRLIDIFTGVACYSLQSHLRTTVPDIGQVETDEIYVGVDKRGAQFVLPVQAKRGKDKLSIVQIWQDVAMCQDKFPDLLCRPIAAILMAENVIALISFEQAGNDIRISTERHYRLVSPEALTEAEIRAYNGSPE